MNFKVFGLYSLLSYFIQFCNVVINLVFIKNLPLTLLGEISIAKVWMQLTDYSHLGLRFSMDRYVPVWEKTEAEKLLYVCVIATSLVSFLISLSALFVSDNQWLTFAFLVWGYSSAIGAVFKSYYRGSGDSRRMLKSYFILPGIPALTQLISVFFGLHAFIAATIISYSAAFFFIWHVGPLSAKEFRCSLMPVFRKVGLTSLYLMGNAIVIFLSFSVDRIFLNQVAGKEVLGEYSIVLFVFSLMLIVPGSIAEFVFPRVVAVAVKTGKVFFPKEIAMVLIPTIAALVIGWIGLPYFAATFTGYIRLVPLMNLALVGVVPYAITAILFHVMSALDMRKELLGTSVFCLFLYASALAAGNYVSTALLDYFVVVRASYGYILILLYTVILWLRVSR